MRPVTNAITSVSLSAISSSRGSDESEVGYTSGQVDRRDDHVDQLDAGKWGDDAAYAIDEQVPAQQGGRADGAVANAPQRQRDQRHDDQRVEDHGRQHGAARVLQA